MNYLSHCSLHRKILAQAQSSLLSLLPIRTRSLSSAEEAACEVGKESKTNRGFGKLRCQRFAQGSGTFALSSSTANGSSVPAHPPRASFASRAQAPRKNH